MCEALDLGHILTNLGFHHPSKSFAQQSDNGLGGCHSERLM